MGLSFSGKIGVRKFDYKQDSSDHGFGQATAIWNFKFIIRIFPRDVPFFRSETGKGENRAVCVGIPL
jgi:hypothetical protein